MLGVILLAVFSPGVLAQSTTTDIGVQIVTTPPALSANSLTDDSLEVTWNWDAISAGFIPPAVTEVRTELSTNGLTYFDQRVSPPGAFSEIYTGLAAGTYTIRVTILDGNDFDYVVGPVNLTSSSSSGGGRGGGTPGSGGPGPIAETDVTLEGLAYPGPTTVVVFTYDGAFQTTLTPNNEGYFFYQTDTLPDGEGIFAFSAEDQDGVLSETVSLPVTLGSFPETFDTIFLPPTITLSSTVLSSGESVEIAGYGYKEGSISVVIDGVTSFAFLVSADEEGRWETSFDTALIDAGTYQVSAVASSADGSVLSPSSTELTFELVDGPGAAPTCGNGFVDQGEQCDDGNLDDGDGCDATCEVETAVCGDGFVTAPEECDDGNLDDGDGCDATCGSEVALPESEILQPDPDVFEDSTVDLTFTASSENGPISTVEIYYSLNNGPLTLYPTGFSGNTATLTGLEDGVYAVYSVARDSEGYLEPAPSVFDATFTVDVFPDFDVIAWPEKRLPPTGNMSMPATLTLYEPGSTTARYEWDIQTDDQGAATIQLDDPILPGVYTAMFKGLSHLSKRLDGVSFVVPENVELDFTEGGSWYVKAGDVHFSKDDFVNALDISALIGYLYGASLEGDFNNDTVVNGLDLSILVGNLYERGDGIQ